MQLLYYKMLRGWIDITDDFKKIHFDAVTIDLIHDLLLQYDIWTKDRKNIIKYPNKNNNTRNMQLYISYQNPTRLCFTKNVTSENDLLLDHDYITLDAAKVAKLQTDWLILFHQKGRMFKESFEDAFVYVKPSEFQNVISKNKNGSTYLIELKMSQMEVLRRRPTADPPCDGSLHDEDRKLIHAAIKDTGCAYFLEQVCPK